MPERRTRTTRISCAVLLVLAISWGCSQSARDGQDAAAPATETASYYQIEGFYVFPLKQIKLGVGADEVIEQLGKPTAKLREGFREPVRVKLAGLPQFDEQWGYVEDLATNWVFFRDGRVVAAFREESDW